VSASHVREHAREPAALDCRRCGACCSYSAEWPRLSLESEVQIARIPREFVDDSGCGMRCTGARCAALVGTVGETTSCAIYPLRPDVCRACSPGDPECLEARRHFGM
jgi:Fe-S-cluster containining protein